MLRILSTCSLRPCTCTLTQSFFLCCVSRNINKAAGVESSDFARPEVVRSPDGLVSLLPYSNYTSTRHGFINDYGYVHFICGCAMASAVVSAIGHSSHRT
ncbi:hypothetical protein V8C42DRAFT_310993 [Trichoderma barbatum]